MSANTGYESSPPGASMQTPLDAFSHGWQQNPDKGKTANWATKNSTQEGCAMERGDPCHPKSHHRKPVRPTSSSRI